MAKEIIEFMQRATEAYEAGSPIISDAEYDALERKYGQVLHSGAAEIPHYMRMYSLQKHYDKDGQPPLDLKSCVKSPKLDGAAVSLLYVEGELVLALTRGDGIKGRDITDKLQLLVPTKISTKVTTQITGEVVAKASVENSRNAASGALNCKSLEEFSTKATMFGMIFVAYGKSPSDAASYCFDMEYLSAQGFKTCLNGDYSEFPTDGIVYRLDNNASFTSAGFTEKFPKGAFAWKEEQEAVTTTLLDVVWNTGNSGKVTPTAILEPVRIGDATISRATLNNIAYIEALDLELGCTVSLIRSGEIIPKIIGRVYD
jgi:DNA ligase (NAD+)